jgi:ribosomal-protein-alanine N-acetyltransferase
LNENEKVIGEAWIYLIEKNRMAKIAQRIAPAYQGRGFATEAMKAIIDFCFTHTELQRIWTDVDTRNIASWKVLVSMKNPQKRERKSTTSVEKN